MRNTWLVILVLFGPSLCSAAEIYPGRPVRVVVAFAPGNTTDNTARIVSRQLSDQLGKQFIVDNRAGAGGLIGYDIVKKSAADGYTLLVAEPGFPLQPSMFKSPPYDANKDYTPITMIARFACALVVIPSLNVNTLKDFVALARANPGKFNYGSGGTGSATHLWGELFNTAAKVNIVHVPFKGSSEVITSMLGGQVHMLVTTIPSFLPLVNAGKLRALAVATDGRRAPSLPDVPSMSEAGISGMAIYGWQGLVGPAGMPKSVVNKLHAEIVKTLALQSVKEPFIAQAGEVVGNSPEEFGKFLRAEVPRWAAVIKSAGITPE